MPAASSFIADDFFRTRKAKDATTRPTVPLIAKQGHCSIT
jgi:hypothetical protein